jgi:TrmH family RNA methyltransferase
MPTRSPLERIRIVLARPSHPGNIGAAARAMKTMGLADLALVAPRHFPDDEAVAMAAGADDVLRRARVHAELAGALADCALAVGFSARERALSHRAQTLREAAPGIVAALAQGRVALVFGNETSGLTNDELARCQRMVTIPVSAAYRSLNLAAAVQLACYEVSLAAGEERIGRGREHAPATGEAIERLHARIEAAAIAAGFLDPKRPGKMMERLRRLVARAAPERSEVNLLAGLFAALGGATPPARGKLRRTGAQAAAARARPSRRPRAPRSRKRSAPRSSR